MDVQKSLPVVAQTIAAIAARRIVAVCWPSCVPVALLTIAARLAADVQTSLPVVALTRAVSPVAVALASNERVSGTLGSKPIDDQNGLWRNSPEAVFFGTLGNRQSIGHSLDADGSIGGNSVREGNRRSVIDCVSLRTELEPS